jgi:glycerophosphoryl diester phosphodiesterase
MQIIAHRGASAVEPENTIRSLKKAEEFGAGMVEVDLRATKDGHVVLLHDPTLHRTHDDSRKISDLTLAQVQAIGISEMNPIPTLDEFLAEANVDVILDIKIGGIEEKVVSKISKFSHKVLISSTHPTVLKKIKALDEKIPLGFIIGPKMGFMFPMLLGTARVLKVHSIHPHHSLVTPFTMKAMRERVAKIYPWTVNSVPEYQILKGFGIDGIFTDHPDLFI